MFSARLANSDGLALLANLQPAPKDKRQPVSARAPSSRDKKSRSTSLSDSGSNAVRRKGAAAFHSNSNNINSNNNSNNSNDNNNSNDSVASSESNPSIGNTSEKPTTATTTTTTANEAASNPIDAAATTAPEDLPDLPRLAPNPNTMQAHSTMSGADEADSTHDNAAIRERPVSNSTTSTDAGHTDDNGEIHPTTIRSADSNTTATTTTTATIAFDDNATKPITSISSNVELGEQKPPTNSVQSTTGKNNADDADSFAIPAEIPSLPSLPHGATMMTMMMTQASPTRHFLQTIGLEKFTQAFEDEGTLGDECILVVLFI
jgi:hypothetical protein